MGGAYIRVEGADRLKRTLRKAGADLGELREANRHAANIVAAAARPLTPIGKPRRRGRGRPKAPGRLMRSLRTSATLRAGVVKAGNARVPYAAVVHYGWRTHGIKERPWLHNAAVASEPIWTKNYTRKMNEVLRQVKGK
mgnify:CR=1 FL=1|nr:MAG TPA: putative tail component [Caudoviricetes sp.]